MNNKNFDLENFLTNYKPKKLTDVLKYYISHEKLKNYKLLTNEDIKMLQPQKYYLRYVKIDDVIKNEREIGHKIHAGGFFVTGGFMDSGIFIKTSDPKKTKYLQLFYKIINPDNTIKINIYNININKYYIFYKPLDKERINDEMRVTLIKLIDNISDE